GPTKPMLVFPFENGITQSHASSVTTSNVIIVPSTPSGRFGSATCVKSAEFASKEEGLSRSNNLGKTRPYPLLSIINLALILYSFPSWVLTVVEECPFSSKDTAVTSCSKETSTPFLTISLARVWSKSARGACQV